jgi:hypothetical protein
MLEPSAFRLSCLTQRKLPIGSLFEAPVYLMTFDALPVQKLGTPVLRPQIIYYFKTRPRSFLFFWPGEQGVVGGWVRGQKRSRVRLVFWVFFYGVFELPSPRSAQKRDQNKSRKNGFGFFVDFL